MSEVNRPEVLAEVARAFQRYEQALVDNDVELLNQLFWHSVFTVRYGVGENHLGHAAIAAYRRGCTPVNPGRKLSDTVITTFGTQFATVNTLFVNPGSSVIGRQSQSWVRFAEGWRIVTAHVSLPAG